MKRYLSTLCLSLFVTVLAVGCGSGKPDWVDEHGAAMSKKEQEKNLYAVGIGMANPNKAMRKKQAVTSARAAMAGNLETYVAQLVKDFMQSHTDYVDPSSASSIQFTSAVSKSITDAHIRGSQVINTWTNPEDGTMYVLMEMPKRQAVENVSPMIKKQARERQAELFKKKADEALKELDNELDKLQEREAAGG